MNRKNIIILLFIFLIIIATGSYIFFMAKSRAAVLHTQTLSVQSVSSEILADGSITAQSQATLHFQTAGKVVYLPFKEGDAVYQGQTIAQLDTYSLQRQLTQALLAYKMSRNTFDQEQQNAQDNVLQNQQRAFIINPQTDENNAINDAVKRIVDDNQANLDNSVINVELSAYALQLATLTSPLNGIMTHEDVTVPNQNVTNVTSFTVADPATLVFRANVSDTDIDYISQGARATIVINGEKDPILGTVEKIYPAKITFPNGQQGYQVDISSEAIKGMKMDQTGEVLITSNAGGNVTLVPAWTVLGGKYMWVIQNGKIILQTVTTGKTHGDSIEVTGGLSSKDRIITDPQIVQGEKYRIL